jgi:hypothetical protein
VAGDDENFDRTGQPSLPASTTATSESLSGLVLRVYSENAYTRGAHFQQQFASLTDLIAHAQMSVARDFTTHQQAFNHITALSALAGKSSSRSFLQFRSFKMPLRL